MFDREELTESDGDDPPAQCGLDLLSIVAVSEEEASGAGRANDRHVGGATPSSGRVRARGMRREGGSPGHAHDAAHPRQVVFDQEELSDSDDDAGGGAGTGVAGPGIGTPGRTRDNKRRRRLSVADSTPGKEARHGDRGQSMGSPEASRASDSVAGTRGSKRSRALSARQV